MKSKPIPRNILSMLFLSVNLYAQEKSFSFITDQDFIYLIDKSKNEDRNYTQGTSFSVSNPDYIGSWFFWPHRVLENLNLGGNTQRQHLMSSISVIGTAFTPRIIDSINPIVGDRPFAFVLGVSSTQVNQIGTPTAGRGDFEAITFNYALLGTTLGYSFQGWAHANIVKGRPTDPKGWNTQIGKGGQPTFLFNYEKVRSRMLTVVNAAVPSYPGMDGFWNFGGSIGYYERIYTGLFLRLGQINPEKISSWAFWGNSLSTASRATMHGGVAPAIKRHFELFGFSRATINLMGRNALLSGLRFGRSAGEYVIDPSWANVGVFDVEFGIAYGVYWDHQGNERMFRIMFKNIMRSPEFNSRIFPERWQYFGSAGIQFSIN